LSFAARGPRPSETGRSHHAKPTRRRIRRATDRSDRLDAANVRGKPISLAVPTRELSAPIETPTFYAMIG
ncbi:MAG: hypothetical protein AAF192_11295, partial [Pseudomonadota bacterium]